MISSMWPPSAASRKLAATSRLLCNAETLHAVAHGAEGDAQQFGGCGAVVAGFLQRLQDRFFLDAVQIFLQRPLAVAAFGGNRDLLGFRRRELQIEHGDALSIAQRHRTLKD